MPRISRIGRGIPFRAGHRTLARSAPRVLRPFAKDAALTIGQLRFGIVVFMTQGVGRVMVRADEIDRHVARLAEFEKLFDPAIARGCRSADFQRWVDLLDGVRREPVEGEVVLLGASPKSLQLRFVPHFKEPLRHFLDAVPRRPNAQRACGSKSTTVCNPSGGVTLPR